MLATGIGASDQLAMHQQTLTEVLLAQSGRAGARSVNLAALHAAVGGGEQRYPYECLMRLAELDAAAGASALPGKILTTLLAQETLPSDLRSRAELLAKSVPRAKNAEQLERLLDACLR